MWGQQSSKTEDWCAANANRHVVVAAMMSEDSTSRSTIEV
jgi:hypothetical protein